MNKYLPGVVFLLLVVGVVLAGCKEDKLPKPAAYLRLDYPEAEYATFDSGCPFLFDFNSQGVAKISIKENCNITIDYPRMKATVFLTYKRVEDNLYVLLRDAQKLTYEHVIKADDIIEQPFIHSEKRVFGMFYRVGGNAATNAQFYATDSLRHFLTGSVYFHAKPNFDSIMPATSYIKEDMMTLLETLEWKQ